jgi:hypothetical protein
MGQPCLAPFGPFPLGAKIDDSAKGIKLMESGETGNDPLTGLTPARTTPAILPPDHHWGCDIGHKYGVGCAIG